jgi:hypothetical protein
MNASERIDRLVAGLTDWRRKMLANLRRIVREADPEIVEEWNWMGKADFLRRRQPSRPQQVVTLVAHSAGGTNSGLTSTPPSRVAGLSSAIRTATSRSGARST